jgi:hypothetical protein
MPRLTRRAAIVTSALAAPALLSAAARALAARGAASVGLSVRSSNEGALRLYQRLGFSGGWDVQELTKRL